MRVVIIRDDNTVYVDGEAHAVDCSKLPADFHALQWDGASGEIEYAPTRCDHCNVRSKKANEFIRDLTPYLPYVDSWKLSKAKHDAEQQAMHDAIVKAQAEFAAKMKVQADASRPQG